MNRVIIRRDTCDELEKHSAGCMPNEACALLLGRTDDTLDAVIVEDVLLMENAKGSPARFAIPDEQLIRAYGIAEKRRMEVVGVFHSHPSSPAVPSSTDERYMVLNPVVWLIYSGDGRGHPGVGHAGEDRRGSPGDYTGWHQPVKSK